MPILILLFVAGCSSSSARTGKGTDAPKSVVREAPTLDEHVALVRKAVAEGRKNVLGWLPRGLGPYEETEDFTPIASGANEHYRGLITSLQYQGLEGDRLCFTLGRALHRDLRMMLESEAVATVEQLLTRGGVWLEAIDSLDELDGRAAWPPGRASVRLDSVAAIKLPEHGFGFSRRGPSDDEGDQEGEVVHEEGKEELVWDLKLCGPRPAVTSETRYLVALSHAPSSDTDQAHDPALEGQHDDGDKDMLRFQHDTLLIWVLSEDGKLAELGVGSRATTRPSAHLVLRE